MPDLLPFALYGVPEQDPGTLDLGNTEFPLRDKTLIGNSQHKRISLDGLKEKFNEDLNERINEIESSGGKGCILKINKDGTRKLYEPDEDTDESRWASALKVALLDAKNGDTIWIEDGKCLIPANECMSQWLPSGVTDVSIKCRSERSAHIYTDAEMAGEDYFLFSGPRNPLNFGAVRNLNFNIKPTEDSWGAFMACKHSLEPLRTGGSGSTPYYDEFGDVNRSGVVIVPDGAYYISQPIFTQSNSLWQATAGRCVLFFGDNIAPLADGTIKFAWTVARNVVGGIPRANFTHDVRISGFVLVPGSTGNELLCAMNYSGAQGSYLMDMTITSFQGGGIFVNTFSDMVYFNRLDIGNIGSRVYPAFMMDRCNNCLIDVLSVPHNNSSGSIKDTNNNEVYYNLPEEDDYRPAIALRGCSSINFSNVLAENTSKSIRLYSCVGVHFHVIEASSPALIEDGTVLDIEVGDLNSVESLLGLGYPNLIVQNGVAIFQTSTLDAWISASHFQGTKRINGLMCSEFKSLGNIGLGVNTFLNFERPQGPAGAQIFRFQNDGDNTNPTLSLSAMSSNSTNVQRFVSFARNNGGVYAGYTTLFRDGAPVFFDDKVMHYKGVAFRTSSIDPTTSDIPLGCEVTWKNTSTGEIRRWVNDGGTLKKSAPYTT